MDKVNIGELSLLFLLLLLLSPLIGRYMASIFKGDPVVISPVIKPVEIFFYRLCGVDPHAEMTWISYVSALLLFNFAGGLIPQGGGGRWLRRSRKLCRRACCLSRSFCQVRVAKPKEVVDGRTLCDLKTDIPSGHAARRRGRRDGQDNLRSAYTAGGHDLVYSSLGTFQ